MSRCLTLALLLALTGCDSPSTDSRGTPAQPLRVELSIADLGRQLAADTSPWGGIPLQIKETSNSADASYRTELNVGDTQQLVIVPSRGDPITFTDRPLHADYYHMGRVLVVRAGADTNPTFHYFVEPVRWYTAPRSEK